MDFYDTGTESYPSENIIKENVEYILSIIKSRLLLFPLNVMTYSYGQIEVRDSREILQLFGTSGFLDCRINAYPVYTGYFGLNTTKKVMIFMDIDLNDFKKHKDPQRRLEKCLNKTVLKVKHEINDNPLVLSTGGGYHIYQPVYFEEMLTSIHFNKYTE